MDIPPSEVHGLGTPWGRVPAWHSSTQSAKEKERFRWGAGSPSVLTRPGGSHALLDLGRAVRDLREEVHHLVEPAELGVVVLDVARGQLGYALDLDRVDHGLEDLLAWRVLEADGDQDDLALAVLLALVAQPDRGRLAAPLELIDEDRRVEVEDKHDAAAYRPSSARESAATAMSRSPL